MESPVWTPMGSMFSMEQMMTTLSARSRMTSSSYSFQPSSDISTSTYKTCETTGGWLIIAIFGGSEQRHGNKLQTDSVFATL